MKKLKKFPILLLPDNPAPDEPLTYHECDLLCRVGVGDLAERGSRLASRVERLAAVLERAREAHASALEEMVEVNVAARAHVAEAVKALRDG